MRLSQPYTATASLSIAVERWRKRKIKGEGKVNKVEAITKIIRENTCYNRKTITHEEQFRSKSDIQKYYENKMALDIGDFAKRTERIQYSQAFEEESMLIQAECVILHPDVAQKLLDILESNKHDFE